MIPLSEHIRTPSGKRTPVSRPADRLALGLLFVLTATLTLSSCDSFRLFDVFAVTNPDNNTEDPAVDPTAPDYQVISSSPPAWGLTGGALSGSFTIQEVAGNSGGDTISWEIFLSSDQILDAGDPPAIAFGVLDALDALESTTIDYSNAAGWPAEQGYYFLLIDVGAGDDTNSVNDRNTPGVAAHIPVVIAPLINESDPNDLPDYQNLNTLEAGALIGIQATMDAPGGNDTYQLTLSNATSPRKIEVTIVWPAGNAIDAIINPGPDAMSSLSTASGREPGPGDAQFRETGLTPGTSHQVQVVFTDEAVAGTPYYLFINTTN